MFYHSFINAFLLLCSNTKADIDAIMPTREEMFSTIKIMKVLTLVFTNSLGNYEDVYMREMDTDGRNFVAAYDMIN